MSRPSVLFVNQHYWPDVASTGQHLTDLAEYLAAEGFPVRVWCSRTRYLGGGLDKPARENRNGVHIRRFRTTGFGRRRLVGRAADYLTFYVQVLARLLAGPRHEIVVFLTTPSILSFVGWIVGKLRRQPYGVWSMDLHPEIEEALGVFPSERPFTRLLHAMSRAGDRNARFVVALGPWMKRRLLEKGVPRERLHTIPVWSRKEEIHPVARSDNPLAEELELGSRFVVMYSGNAGLAHRFEDVLEAMRILRRNPAFFFLFVGGGPRRREIETFADRHGLKYFRYLDYFPREKLHLSLSLGDVHLLTLHRDMAGLAAPGKLYGIMAAGRPTLMVGPRGSEPGHTVTMERAGVVVDPAEEMNPPEAVVRTLRRLEASPDLRRRLGEAARRAFLARYERETCCRAWAELLQADGTAAARTARGRHAHDSDATRTGPYVAARG